MNNSNKAVCFMPVRLNSTRIEEKSIKPLGGRPLFCWLLSVLDKLGIEVHVYASECDKLEGLMDFQATNVIFTKRPEKLDGDDVKGIDIYKAFREQVPADIYLLVHCTSPFTKYTTLRKVLDPVLNGDCASSLTVEEKRTFAWFEGKPLNFGIPRIQTQLLEPIYFETSGAYCYRSSLLDAGDRSDMEPKKIVVSWPETEDIDDPDDFSRCESLASALRNYK